MSPIADVIKYEGDNSTFVWKHPRTDFNSLTQLIVHESQEAIFFMNGQALDLFGPGRYTLETENIPMIGKQLRQGIRGRTPFHCEVYFINKTVQMAFKWGTDSKVRFLEPTYGVPLEIGACGEMNLTVSDSRKLLVKLVGTMKGIAWDDHNGFTKSLASSFRPLISTAVKTNLSSCIKSQGINILEVDENLGVLSDVLKRSITPGFEEYGLTIPEFYVTTVVLPENDPNVEKMRKLHSYSLEKKMVEAGASYEVSKAEAAAAVTAAQRQAVLEEETTATERERRAAERELIRAQATKVTGLAEAEVMRAKGYSQKDVLQAEVQKAYAEGIGNMTISGGGAGVAGDMIGIGVGMAAAGAVVPQFGEMFKGFGTEQSVIKKITCPNCNSELPENSKFCAECGTKIALLNENEVICPVCGKKTAKGKFCMECGASLVVKCAKCGAELPTGAKFCQECGEKI